MLEVLLIIAGVLVTALILNGYQNKYQSLQGKIFNIVVIIMLFLLASSVAYVYRSTDSNVESIKDIFSFGGVYFKWVLGIFSNVKDITGYAISSGSNSTIEKTSERVNRR